MFRVRFWFYVFDLICTNFAILFFPYNLGQNTLHQIDRYMSGTPPHPANNVVSLCRETSTLLKGVGERLFIQALPLVMLQNLFQIFWPGLPLEFFKEIACSFQNQQNSVGRESK